MTSTHYQLTVLQHDTPILLRTYTDENKALAEAARQSGRNPWTHYEMRKVEVVARFFTGERTNDQQ